jgi:hypothetical protein
MVELDDERILILSLPTVANYVHCFPLASDHFRHQFSELSVRYEPTVVSEKVLQDAAPPEFVILIGSPLLELV